MMGRGEVGLVHAIAGLHFVCSVDNENKVCCHVVHSIVVVGKYAMYMRGKVSFSVRKTNCPPEEIGPNQGAFSF